MKLSPLDVSLNLIIPLLFFVVAIFIITAPSTEEANADSQPLQMARGMQQYEFRVSGEQQPIKVVEFLNRQGNVCTLVYTTQRNVEMELSCNYNK